MGVVDHDDENRFSLGISFWILCVLGLLLGSQSKWRSEFGWSIHLRKLTWNLKITHLQWEIIFQTFIIVFHVNFLRCVKMMKQESMVSILDNQLYMVSRVEVYCLTEVLVKTDQYGTSRAITDRETMTLHGSSNSWILSMKPL